MMSPDPPRRVFEGSEVRPAVADGVQAHHDRKVATGSERDTIDGHDPARFAGCERIRIDLR